MDSLPTVSSGLLLNFLHLIRAVNSYHYLVTAHCLEQGKTAGRTERESSTEAELIYSVGQQVSLRLPNSLIGIDAVD